MNLCAEYDNAATVARTAAGPVWLEQPERVHISTEVMDDDESAAFIARAYTVTPGCREDVLHGDLAPRTPESADERGA